MSGIWIEPIEPPEMLSHGGTISDPLHPCGCRPGWWTRTFGARGVIDPPARVFATSAAESHAFAGPAPRLWLSLLKGDVDALNNALMRDGSWDVFHAFGVLAWVYERVASIRLRVVASAPSFRMRVVQPHIPSAMLGTPWSPSALIQIALAVGRNSPWGIGTFCQVFTHELLHWMGSLFGALSPDWHTSHTPDLMCRAPARRVMWQKHDPTTQVYYGVSFRELEWLRTRIGPQLIET